MQEGSERRSGGCGQLGHGHGCSNSWISYAGSTCSEHTATGGWRGCMHRCRAMDGTSTHYTPPSLRSGQVLTEQRHSHIAGGALRWAALGRLESESGACVMDGVTLFRWCDAATTFMPHHASFHARCLHCAGETYHPLLRRTGRGAALQLPPAGLPIASAPQQPNKAHAMHSFNPDRLTSEVRR